MRWSGLPQPISAALTGAIRRSLQGTDADEVGLTKRAASKLEELREEFAPLIDDKVLREVKFGDMVPETLLRAEVAGR